MTTVFREHIDLMTNHVHCRTRMSGFLTGLCVFFPTISLLGITKQTTCIESNILRTALICER